jgi:HSP20 family protein
MLTRLFPWMNQLQTQVNRLLDEFTTSPGLAYSYPPLNVWDDDQNVYAEAELPGMQLDKTEIFVAEGNKLTIQGERALPEIAGGVWHRRERGFGKFSRTFVLPFEVQADKVDARFENGVLRLTMPKSERVKPRRIHVKAD